VSATVLLISLMAYVRLVVFPHEFVPLAYAVFMLVALWHRDRRLLWTMAGSFLVVVLVKMTMVMPESAVPLPHAAAVQRDADDQHPGSRGDCPRGAGTCASVWRARSA
jgi:hypothetical protein